MVRVRDLLVIWLFFGTVRTESISMRFMRREWRCAIVGELCCGDPDLVQVWTNLKRKSNLVKLLLHESSSISCASSG
jgi:hypothetical protein